MANTYQEATETKRDGSRHSFLVLFSASEEGRKAGTEEGRRAEVMGSQRGSENRKGDTGKEVARPFWLSS